MITKDKIKSKYRWLDIDDLDYKFIQWNTHYVRGTISAGDFSQFKEAWVELMNENMAAIDSGAEPITGANYE
jgi:hypothetical protein